MNKTFLNIAFLFFVAFFTQAQQNLVVNGDMEDFLNCPISESIPFQNPKEIEKCIGWKAPTYGTSDYFNTCTSNPTISVPTNALGEQTPYSGNGYIGGFFASYNWGAGDDGYSGIMWWEYVQGQFVEPLEQGKMYKFSMKISLAEGSDLMINEIGIYFSKTPISSPNTAALTVSPQIVFYDPDYFSDTLNWIHLETLYTASGGEQYLTMGNFRDNITTDTLRRYDLEPIAENPRFTYFYIDDVVLTDASEEIETPNIFTPNGDGINDFWLFPFKKEFENSVVSICNRWGNVVYESGAKGFLWNGLAQDGKECSDGVYFYRVSNTDITGFIQLIR